MRSKAFVVILRRLRAPLISLIAAYALSVLGFVLIPGQDGDGNPVRMDFFHAFYFVSFMGSTIGFGEIPYPFTGAQRMWTVFSIYATVVVWLYAIGSFIALMQNPALRANLAGNAFRRQVRRIREPFYLVCGAGDTGTLLIEALAARNIRTVAIDRDAERILGLEIADRGMAVPALCADATGSDILIGAGLQHPWCRSVVALTSHDETNLKIAVICKLLNPDIPAICRAETTDIARNMASFGTEYIINPYESFADYLRIALTSPGLMLLHSWLTSPTGTPLTEPLFPPQGHWVLCGHGRFGSAIRDRLESTGCTVTVIEIAADKSASPESTVIGRGTEADTLTEARIQQAVGLVAGTDSDPNNLSIVMTAKALNSELFIVARQNRLTNQAIFEAAHLDFVTRHSETIENRILAIITTPLTAEFLERAEHQSETWANLLISRISGVVDDEVPHTWVVHVTPTGAPALIEMFARKQSVWIEHLLRDPDDRKQLMPAIALMAKGGENVELLPGRRHPVHAFDQILFCGDPRAERRMRLTLVDPNALTYTMTGKRPARGWLWRKLTSAPATHTVAR